MAAVRPIVRAGAASAALLLPLAAGAAGEAPDMMAATLRMALGLVAVLAVLGGTAWLSRRFRVSGRLQGGLIEIMSGISLGSRERLILVRVGGEQVLVGVSPAGIRTLHVIGKSASANFADVMARKP